MRAFTRSGGWIAAMVCGVVLAGAGVAAWGESAEGVYAEAGVAGGVVAHVGCGEGALTAGLAAREGVLLLALDRDADAVAAAREALAAAGVYGRASADVWRGDGLPFIDGFVNLAVVEAAVDEAELVRVLAPEGVALVREGDGGWRKVVKPRPAELDEWTHYLYDATNNAVAQDAAVGPPARLQWVGGPRYSRHHDRMSSMSGAVTAGGRVFYVFDEAPAVSILLPPQWKLIARDAFSGAVLWKRDMGPWHDHLWGLKSGPAQLPRKLVTDGDRVYVTLGLGDWVSALDAATGETVREYEATAAAEELVEEGGVLFVVANNVPGGAEELARLRRRGAPIPKVWDEKPRVITAVEADSGAVLWQEGRRVMPGTLAAAGDGVFFHDGEAVVCLDRADGAERWRSAPVARCDRIEAFFLPTLVVQDGVVVCAGGQTAGHQTGSWYEQGEDTMTALDASTGAKLWSAYHPPSGYRSPEDLLVVDGVVWCGETTSGHVEGLFTGRDLHTGEVMKEFTPDVDTYWFHHRCYRGKATCNYLLMSRTGIEFVDTETAHWETNHWVRGACLYGILPANGLIYAPPNPCACYQEAKAMGFNALAPAQEDPRVAAEPSWAGRLEQGPAYGKRARGAVDAGDWPTYRCDAGRSGHTEAAVGTGLRPKWRAEIGGRLSSLTAAADRVLVASIDRHTVHALDADSGREKWVFRAGGRVDSPPTVYAGLALFGCRDGYVYAVRVRDGKLAWRFLAAPADQRLMALEQIESVWPVHGSVLVRGGVLYCVAGRSMFLDGGLRFWRLDPETGAVLGEQTLDRVEEATGKDLQDYVSWLNMPPALPDVLSSDDRFVYMRSQPFEPDGTRLPLEAMPTTGDGDRGAPQPVQDAGRAHLFCPTGFLDDANWHRTYWMYGSTFVSGWCGYYLSGKVAPAGKILAFDDDQVYGFGRYPKYYKWSTPIEHRLFAAAKAPETEVELPKLPAAVTAVTVAKSDSLNCAKTGVTVEAWVRTTTLGGVVAAQGGNNLGYVLYVDKGRPCFTVRNAGVESTAKGGTRIDGRWAHVAGVLGEDKTLRVYVDGALDGKAEGASLIQHMPAEAMEIGADEGSCVGSYSGPHTLVGDIDAVRVYMRALKAAEVAACARGEAAPDAALAMSFDDETARDTSGKGNDGEVVGATFVEGKEGKALHCTGGGRRGPEFLVDEHWAEALPIFVRAMCVAGETVFVAGPPDEVDEDEAFMKVNLPETQAQLAEYAKAFAGEKGASLMAASTETGGAAVVCALDAPPVFDGLIAAQGRLYVADVSGAVVCLEE